LGDFWREKICHFGIKKLEALVKSGGVFFTDVQDKNFQPYQL
jgi:hypothetical protein